MNKDRDGNYVGRKYQWLQNALVQARNGGLYDKYNVEQDIKLAEFYSLDDSNQNIPLSKKVIDYIWEEYMKKEPARLGMAVKLSSEFLQKDKTNANNYLRRAKEHSHSPQDAELINSIERQINELCLV